jgi:hypothetical protein
VDHDRVHADELEEHDVLGEMQLEFVVFHGVPAIFDDQCLTREALDVGQRFKQCVCFLNQCVHLALPSYREIGALCPVALKGSIGLGEAVSN